METGIVETKTRVRKSEQKCRASQSYVSGTEAKSLASSFACRSEIDFSAANSSGVGGGSQEFRDRCFWSRATVIFAAKTEVSVVAIVFRDFFE